MMILLVLPTIVLYLVVETAAICYTPAGQNVLDTKYYDPANTYTPCNSDPNIASTCCSQNETCGNDNLCRDDVGGIYRESCTQSNWETTGCSQLCPQYRDAGVLLTSCPDGSFCCGFNNTACCDAGQGTLLDARGQVLLSNGQVSTIAGAMYSTSSTSSSTSVASSSSTTTSTTLASSTAISAGPNQNSSTPIGAIIGGVIGGVAVLLLVVILILLILRRGKRRDQAYTQSWGNSDPRLGGPATRDTVSRLDVNEASNTRSYSQGAWTHEGRQPYGRAFYPQYTHEAYSKPTPMVHEIEASPKRPAELH